jgi:cytochrome c biogenesis protein CcmG/thiol:disulfide interchange protein DsbE
MIQCRWLPAAVAGGAALAVLGLLALLAAGFDRASGSASPLMNTPAPGFALRSLDGRAVSLASLRGHPVVLNFWASWCTTCPVDHANLRLVWHKYASRGVDFIGVAFNDTVSGDRAFLREHGGAWPSLMDPDGQIAVDYGITGVPETFLIDRHGIIRFRSPGPISTSGPVTPSILEKRLADLLRAA